jgi:hypothetical protein
MNMFNRRNAMIGYFALKALKHSRRNATLGYLAAQGVEHTRARRRGGRVLRLTSYVALGVVSAGLLAGFVYFWRQHAGAVAEAVDETSDAAQDLAADVADASADEAEFVADDVSQALETTPAA